MKRTNDKKTLFLFILAFVLLACAWNHLIPPYENLDEIEHSEVIRHIAVTGRLPVHGESETNGFEVGQEASQPPLYHILAAAWMRVLSLSLEAPSIELIPEDVVACGPSDTFYNKATWTHQPYTQSTTSRTVHTLRLFSTLLQIATVAGAWTLARRIFPQGPLPALVTAIVAFNPQFLLVAAGVNNDNLMTPLATWGLVIAFDLWDQGPTTQRLLLYGTLSGLATLSKLSGLALLGLGGLTLLAYAWHHRASTNTESTDQIAPNNTTFLDLVRWGLLITLPALLLIATWMLRNLRLYGDPTALAPMLEIVGRRTSAPTFGEMPLMIRSYWGQLPCTFYPSALYWPYWLLMAGGLAGLLLAWRRLDHRQRAAAWISALWFLIIVVAWIRWNSITPAPGGRLLFPASTAVALLLTLGWRELCSRAFHSAPSQQRRHTFPCRLWAALLPLWAIGVLHTGPARILAPPPTLALTQDNPSSTTFSFDNVLTLRSYQANIVQPGITCTLLSTESACTPQLDLTLYWHAAGPIDANWTMAIQLVSLTPGTTDLRLNYNHWPGRGNLPTSAWPLDRIIRDTYRLPLPYGDDVTQAWALTITFFDLETGERLPVTFDGQNVGNSARLEILRVPGQAITCTDQGQLSQPASLGDAVELTHAEIKQEDAQWHVTLYWESLATLPEDYTVFVHAYGADGTLLATGDGPPMNGAFPTRLWLPDDQIKDTHTLPLSVDAAPAQIMVGLYHPTTGERLPAFQAGERVMNDAVIVWGEE